MGSAPPRPWLLPSPEPDTGTRHSRHEAGAEGRGQVYLFSDAPPAFLGVLELEGLPEQGVEGLESAVVGSGVGGHSKGGHMHHALYALWREGSSLHPNRTET